MTRLREEILNKVGNSRRPTYDDIRDMKYLRAVINGESLHTYYSSTSLGQPIEMIRNTSALSYRVRPIPFIKKLTNKRSTKSLQRPRKR
jgi:hypothetical protein